MILCAQAYCAQHGLVCMLLLWQIQQERETLVIDDFRIESSAGREELWRLNSQAGPQGRGAKDDWWLL